MPKHRGPVAPNPQWERFAEREPYFAVLTAPRFLRANLTPAHEREFFASGEDLVAWMYGVIEARLSPQFAPISTLEYGCGPGRLALPLARRPGSITAVDRSAVMLSLAREEAKQRDLAHIVFQTPSELFSAPRKFDLVVCHHVLQRLRPREGIEVLRRLIDLISPNGVGVFQWPYRTDDSDVVAASRWLRERVPAANTLANLVRGKPAGDPFVPTHTYRFDEILPEFALARFRSTHVAFEHQGNLDCAILFAQKPERQATSAWPPATNRATAHVPAASEGDIASFNASAEAYFSTLPDWEHHLTKPFSQIDETPPVLASLAALLPALRLSPGMRVLDFGAGPGWLSHRLTQLGCRMILLDVSPTALEIGRELYRRQPIIGDRPAPEFLPFDGRRIDLPDASIDRVICFDAFHHVANPDAVLREFGRILVPGGIAGFAEPGPRHAEAPRSQFESHTYGVVELDVDVHAVWRTAQSCGFDDLAMCVFHGPPYPVSLEEYEDLVAGGVAQERWLASTRSFLHYVRNFVLVKAGGQRADSRMIDGLACEIRATLATPPPAAEGPPIVIDAVVTNVGTATWLAADAGRGAVVLGAHLYQASGALVSFDFQTAPLTDPPREIPPGETVQCRITLPPLAPGQYRIELDCVAAHVTWFALRGSRPATVVVDVG